MYYDYLFALGLHMHALARKTCCVYFYLNALERVSNAGYDGEISWQRSTDLDQVTEQVFLREFAWVVLNAGMAERVIRKKFSKFSHCFYEWKSSKRIVENQYSCRRSALSIFGHKGKVDAIISCSESVFSSGFDSVKHRIRSYGIDFLLSFPFMGPATSCHLAKNLGFNFVKPDRHLLRLANRLGYLSPDEMCEDISSVVCRSKAEIDLVLWRFSTVEKNYLRLVDQFSHNLNPLSLH